MHRVVILVIAAVALATASCGDVRSDALEPAGQGRAPTTPTDPASDDDMDPDGPRAQAIADLAERLDVDPAEIDVVAYDEVTWRDGSLGCPEPGGMYTQALVEGYRIVLRAEGDEAAYHGSAGGPPRYCADPDPRGAIDA